MMSRKAALRKLIKETKAQYTPKQLQALSANTIAILQSLPQWQSAQHILLYHSLPDEVDTHALIIENCKTKTIYLPRVAGDELEIVPYNENALQKGAFNITEPQTKACETLLHIDLAVIPGIAFDVEGNRLGRGKGYYDKLLPKLSCPTIGICFPFQLLSTLPIQPHDQAIEVIITANGKAK